VRVRKVVSFAVALVTATLLGPVPEVHAAGLTQGAVNFQAQGVPTPSGYVADWGLGFDSTRGFGWIQPTSSEPLSLLGKGRDRNRTADQRYDTLMHMQHTPADLGRWEVAVPTGVYDVTVAVGDPQYFDSVHNLNVEGINAVSSFAPSAADPFRTVTVRVVVDDGRLTLDQNGGTNTKLNFVEYVEVPSGRAVVSVDPADVATDVPANASVTLGLSHPVSSASITPETVKILDPTGSQVPGIYNTDGAGALVGFTPSERLALGTTYSVRVTSDLRDVDGYRFAEFTSTFTTSTSPPPSTGIAFEKVPFDVVGGPTSVVLGPDGRLYASTAVGQILRWDLTTEGTPAGPAQTIDHWTYQRTITGLHFDPSSTATDLKLWVSHSFLGDQDVANFQGKISVLTGANLETVRDVITGLPRSTRDHMNNGIDFGPDGKLYIAQGSLSGYGAPDSYWGDRAETPLSASILVADVNTDPRFASPVDVNTDAGYDATAADAPVKVYASGTRNPFDLVWHTNGKLYAPVNESASGNAPAGPGGSPPALTGLPAMNDFLAQVKPGRYYGHPNPSRGEYTLRGGNPTSAIDPFEVPQYPVGVAPDPRWDAPARDLGSHRSPNGVDEYRAQAFDGALKGKLLVANFGNGDDLTAITLDSTGAATGVEQVAWGFNNPLDVTSNPTSGVAWVAEFGSQASGAGGKITLLRPISSAVVPMRRINFQNSSAPSLTATRATGAFPTTRVGGTAGLNRTATPL
jgi:glucose/arabinose dehydrogenase